jgi:hypothetical protein
VRRDFYWLASVFLPAVILFGTFAKLFHDNAWLLGSYLLVLGGIGLKALRGRWMLWEAAAEDYRAVAEILRVQRARWSAGLTARVDREHMQGVDQDLAPIRDCAKMIIGWILLRHGGTTPFPRATGRKCAAPRLSPGICAEGKNRLTTGLEASSGISSTTGRIARPACTSSTRQAGACSSPRPGAWSTSSAASPWPRTRHG